MKQAIEGRPPTETELLLKSWATEIVKGSLGYMNESLRQLITLNCALLGGSILMDDKIVGSGFRLAGSVCFALSLLVSFAGLIPFQAPVNPCFVDEFRRNVERALRYRKNYLRIAAALLMGGFVAVMVGLACRLI